MKPLSPNDAARLFRELAMEALPADLRPLDALRSHPVLAALENLPRAIWQTVPLLRQGKTMAEIAKDLADATTTESGPDAPTSDAGDASSPSGSEPASPQRPPLADATGAPRWAPLPGSASAPDCDPHRRRRRRHHHHHGGAADRGEAGERRRTHR